MLSDSRERDAQVKNNACTEKRASLSACWGSQSGLQSGCVID